MSVVILSRVGNEYTFCCVGFCVLGVSLFVCGSLFYRVDNGYTFCCVGFCVLGVLLFVCGVCWFGGTMTILFVVSVFVF